MSPADRAKAVTKASLRKAKACVKLGRFDGALRGFAQALVRDPRSDEALKGKRSVARLQAAFEKAKAAAAGSNWAYALAHLRAVVAEVAA